MESTFSNPHKEFLIPPRTCTPNSAGRRTRPARDSSGDGCNGKLHAWCCHCPATSAAFTVKVAAWLTARSTRRWVPQYTR